MAAIQNLEKIDITQHHLIVLVIILIVFVTGLFFGVQISNATRGTEGLLIIVFSLCFLNLFVSFLLFTHTLHTRKKISEIHERVQSSRKI